MMPGLRRRVQRGQLGVAPPAAESPGKPQSPKESGSSLSIQIGILYILLALINITFFSVAILENQTDLLLTNFKYQAENVVKAVVDDDLSELQFSPDPSSPGFQELLLSLQAYDVSSFTVFGADGDIWYEHGHRAIPGTPPAAPGSSADGITPAAVAGRKRVDENLRRRAAEFKTEASLFHSRYSIILNEEDFSLEFLMPLRSANRERAFLNATMSVGTIRERMRYIYYQVALAIVWGAVFHAAFAVFLYRVIFQRVGILKSASLRMAGGELGARTSWRRRRNPDELDALGNAFNTMGENIQNQVETITKLNTQIQTELEIGKEVQGMFLGDLKLIEEFQPALFYRPLREVSGDVYRFYTFPNGFKGVFFADASGHGVSAALVTTITIMSLEEILKQNVPPPQIMAHLSDLMSVRLNNSFFATAAFMIFAPGGKTYITNAGHNDPMFLTMRGNRVINEIASHGPPLGIMEGMSYKMIAANTRRGDKIFVYSDGLVETTNDDLQEFGLERLQNFLVENWRKDNQTVVDLLQEEFSAFATKYRDDVSFLLLEIP